MKVEWVQRRMRTESGPCVVVVKLGCPRDISRKDQINKNKQIIDFLNTRTEHADLQCLYTQTRQSVNEAREQKEFKPLRPWVHSSLSVLCEPSKSFSSYCTNKTYTCQGGTINNCDAANGKYFLPIYTPFPLRLPVSPRWHSSAITDESYHHHTKSHQVQSATWSGTIQIQDVQMALHLNLAHDLGIYI